MRSALLAGFGAERAGDSSPDVDVREGGRQVKDDSAHGDDDAGPQLEEMVAKGGYLGSGVRSPTGMEADLLQEQSLGFSPPGRNGSPEVAIIDQDSGFLDPCDWLQLGRQGDVTVTWLRGTEPTHFVAPPGWKPGSMQRISLQQLTDDYDMIEVRDGVEIYRHRKTGEMQYVGRPKLAAGKKWWQFWK